MRPVGAKIAFSMGFFRFFQNALTATMRPGPVNHSQRRSKLSIKVRFRSGLPMYTKSPTNSKVSYGAISRKFGRASVRP